MLPNKSLQATGATASALEGVGDSLLPGFVAASLHPPVPERKTRELHGKATADIFE